ncbi:hypothetical protein K8R04_04460 [Candidatus Uhrbacteria bacterium]|nr:hypothetical protein [Candidatus Uhrbacteria bacterium]
MTTAANDSQLPKNEERFLSKYLSFLLALGYITVEKLYEIFPPLALFTRYEKEMERRRAIFSLTKLGSGYAEEFDLAASAVILTKGVKLGDVKLDDLYRVVSPDELVRVHDRKVLYALTKDAKPFATKDDKSRQLMAHAIDDMIAERLGSDNPADVQADREAGNGVKVHQFVIDAIGELTFVSDHIPEEARGRIFKAGLDAHKTGLKFTPDLIFDAVPTSELVGYVPFDKLEPAIEAVALKFGWIDPPKAAWEVPKPDASVLPPEVLDSVAPPPPTEDATPATDPPKAKNDLEEPEIEMTGGDGLTLDADDSDVDQLLGSNPPPAPAEDDDEKTRVGPPPNDKKKLKGPPPLKRG